VENNVPLDVVSSSLFRKGKLETDGLRFRNRTYRNVLFPYPEVLDPAVLHLISVMDKSGFPLLLGGAKPRWTSKGERIPHEFPASFDPRDADFPKHWQAGPDKSIAPPGNALGSVIQTGTETLLLFCPSRYDGPVEGEARYGGTRFRVERSDGLTIYSLRGENIRRVL
jgi:hypothetical protein